MPSHYAIFHKIYQFQHFFRQISYHRIRLLQEVEVDRKKASKFRFITSYKYLKLLMKEKQRGKSRHKFYNTERFHVLIGQV